MTDEEKRSMSTHPVEQSDLFIPRVFSDPHPMGGAKLFTTKATLLSFLPQ